MNAVDVAAVASGAPMPDADLIHARFLKTSTSKDWSFGLVLAMQ
jgi:hypothetical protein